MQAGQSRNEPLVANARMYSTGAAQAGNAWTSLLNWVVAHADAPLEVLDYPPPKPLDALWARADLGCTFMCGLPYARDPRPLTPIIAPVVRGARYQGRPIYFTDIVVRTDSPYRTLEDTFGRRVGYTSIIRSPAMSHCASIVALSAQGWARALPEVVGRSMARVTSSTRCSPDASMSARSTATCSIWCAISAGPRATAHHRHHPRLADTIIRRDGSDWPRLGRKIASRFHVGGMRRRIESRAGHAADRRFRLAGARTLSGFARAGGRCRCLSGRLVGGVTQ